MFFETSANCSSSVISVIPNATARNSLLTSPWDQPFNVSLYNPSIALSTYSPLTLATSPKFKINLVSLAFWLRVVCNLDKVWSSVSCPLIGSNSLLYKSLDSLINALIALTSAWDFAL